ncbi:MAG: 4-(cytidine 5'-diphospho)-2-C-methyl-D-erythritol kinase [Trueperaceae bacterium]|nr:4-(cytidine 5'-diphospho)-2-C-methyl-D-erythritol kinase [Trueperaceae bacterium]
MSGAATATVFAPGKVNLGLRVSALRGDGYHEIDTLFATVDVGDVVHVRRTGRGVHGRVVDAREAEGGDGGDAPLPDLAGGNLAADAAAAWRAAADPGGLGVEIVLEKRLPVAAGLGGGSSDAGAVLRALQALAGPDALPADALQAVAKGLGSDVPFFAAGVAAARGRGRGERLRPTDLPPRWGVLLRPPVAVSAGEAYRALGGFGPPIAWDAVLEAWAAGGTPRWRNDLQPGVGTRHAPVRAALAALRNAELGAPILSGSGATCFALAPDEAAAHRAADHLAGEHPDAWVRAVRVPAPDALRAPTLTTP